MKQQFFVGDVVEVVEVNTDLLGISNNWYDVGEKFVVAGWNDGAHTSSEDQDHITVEGEDKNICVLAKHVRILTRAWQKNTGKQPVDDDVEVFVKRTDDTIDRAEACVFVWYCGIVEWRIADSVSYDEEPESIPPSHVALGDNLVQVGGQYMKIWCDTCQGTGEIDETLGGESFSGRDTTCPDCDGKGWWERVIASSVDNAPVQQDKKHSHYFKKCGYDYVDVYRTIKMFDVTDPCLQHAVKKLLVTGGRGFKDIETDVQDVIDTLERWKEMFNEDRARGD